jgi:hypothetical protein
VLHATVIRCGNGGGKVDRREAVLLEQRSCRWPAGLDWLVVERLATRSRRDSGADKEVLVSRAGRSAGCAATEKAVEELTVTRANTQRIAASVTCDWIPKVVACGLEVVVELSARCFEISRPARIEWTWSCDRQGYWEKPRKAPSYTADDNQHMEGPR